ncbi:MAG: glycosyltransferase, partial [Ktedonobacterales bacterium]
MAQHHEVTLLALVDDVEQGARDAQALGDLAHRVVLVPLPGRQRKRMQQLKFAATLRSYLLTEFSPPTASAALATLYQRQPYAAVLFESVLVAGLAVPPGVRVLLDQHNIEHELVRRTYEQETRPARKLYSLIEFRSLKVGELQRCRRAEHVLVTSERERALLAGLVPSTHLTVMPNGVDIESFTGAARAGEVSGRVVFTGTLGYHPNTQAVMHFARTCWPRIHAEEPDATWLIVGSDPPPEVRRLAKLPGVRVTGTVPAVQPYLSQAAVAVVPLLVGGGTRLKILEALAMRVAVVTTSVGCEGLGLVPGEHALVANTPEEFAAAVVTLLRDPARRAAIAAAGWALVQQQYAWERCVEPLLRVLKPPLEEPPL